MESPNSIQFYHCIIQLDFSPSELQHFADHLKGLSYPDMPDYDLLENCLIVAMKRLGICSNDPFGMNINIKFSSTYIFLS